MRFYMRSTNKRIHFFFFYGFHVPCTFFLFSCFLLLLTLQSRISWFFFSFYFFLNFHFLWFSSPSLLFFLHFVFLYIFVFFLLILFHFLICIFLSVPSAVDFLWCLMFLISFLIHITCWFFFCHIYFTLLFL